MVSFHDLTLHTKESVYKQIITFVKHQILAGRIEHHEELPSRRELALQLSINPNTVQKAYKILEEEGIITTAANTKSVIVVNEQVRQRISEAFMKETISHFIQACHEGGLSFQATVELLAKEWN